MFGNSLKIFYFILILFFLYLVSSTYFSTKNITLTNKKYNETQEKQEYDTSSIPLIKNDTNNVIIYSSDEIFENKIKKRKVWELLK